MFVKRLPFIDRLLFEAMGIMFLGHIAVDLQGKNIKKSDCK
jgi:hypothetical protein